jgi:hypothetical protein
VVRRRHEFFDSASPSRYIRHTCRLILSPDSFHAPVPPTTVLFVAPAAAGLAGGEVMGGISPLHTLVVARREAVAP